MQMNDALLKRKKKPQNLIFLGQTLLGVGLRKMIPIYLCT